MGCGSSVSEDTRLRSTSPPTLSTEEKAALEKRKEMGKRALAKLCGIDEGNSAEVAKMKTIAVALSGGAWRAMTASVAFLDGLSSCGLLDGVSCIAGLSGGSWTCMVTTLAGTKNGCPFHNASAPHPWAFSEKFDQERHDYEGLIKMRSEKVIQRACRADNLFCRTFGKLRSLVIDAQLFFPYMLVFGEGSDFVERLSNVLADELFLWETDKKKRRDMTLEDKSPPMKDGIFPVICVAAIDSDPQSETRPSVWADFSPFGARHYMPQTIDKVPIDSLIGDFNGKVQSVRAHTLMGIMGSSFAVDERSLFNNSSKFVQRIGELLGCSEDGKPIYGKMGITRVTDGNEESPFGDLRDAGLDFNVPFPLVFEEESNRRFDIVIVNAASGNDLGGICLQRAMERGYIELKGLAAEEVGQDFPESTGGVKVFYPTSDKWPIIVYSVTLTEDSSAGMMASPEKIQHDCASVRLQILKHVYPAVMKILKGDYVQPPTEIASKIAELEAVVDEDVFRCYDKDMQNALSRASEQHKLSNPYHVLRVVEEVISTRLDKEYDEERLAMLAYGQFKLGGSPAPVLLRNDPVDNALVQARVLKRRKSNPSEADFLHPMMDEYLSAVNAIGPLVSTNALKTNVLKTVLHRNSVVQTDTWDKLSIFNRSHEAIFLYMAWICESVAKMGETKPAEMLREKVFKEMTSRATRISLPQEVESFDKFEVREELRHGLGIDVAAEVCEKLEWDLTLKRAKGEKYVRSSVQEALVNAVTGCKTLCTPQGLFLVLESLARFQQNDAFFEVWQLLTEHREKEQFFTAMPKWKEALILASIGSDAVFLTSRTELSSLGAALQLSKGFQCLVGRVLDQQEEQPPKNEAVKLQPAVDRLCKDLTSAVTEACSLGSHRALRTLLAIYEGCPLKQWADEAMKHGHLRVLSTLTHDAEATPQYAEYCESLQCDVI